VNREEFCQKILKIDDKIRFVSIEGKQSYLTPDETENSMVQCQYRWAGRKKMAPKIGAPIFAMAKYGKVFRFTIPVGKAGLILVSTELNVAIEDIVEKICDVRDKFYS